jgi:hypothetical protein
MTRQELAEARAIVRAYIVVYAPDRVLEAMDIIDAHLGFDYLSRLKEKDG